MVVAALGIGLLTRLDRGTPSDRTVALAGAEAGIDGSAELRQDDEFTAIHLVASGLEPDLVYAAWLAPEEGEKQAAGTFRPDEDGRVEVDLVSAYPLESAARVWVTDHAGATVLNAP